MMEALLQPLDVARVRLLRALGPFARVFAVDRDGRVAALAALATVTALLLTAGAPMWSLALGPVVLGVPHLVADVRYLVVRPGLHRDRRLAVAVGAPLAIAAFGGGLRAALVAVAAALIVAAPFRDNPLRRAAALAALLPFAWIAWRSPAVVDAVFAQLHNAVAIVLWWAWRPRGEQPRWRWAGLAFIALGVLAILSGALSPLMELGLGWRSPAAGFGVGGLAHALAPGVSTRWALRFVLLYAFGQSVHYAVWLRMLPDEDRPRATPRTFRASFRALSSDLGPWLLGASASAALVLLGWGAIDLGGARDAYVRFAAFHGYLELAVLAVGLSRGRLRLTPSAA